MVGLCHIHRISHLTISVMNNFLRKFSNGEKSLFPSASIFTHKLKGCEKTKHEFIKKKKKFNEFSLQHNGLQMLLYTRFSQ